MSELTFDAKDLLEGMDSFTKRSLVAVKVYAETQSKSLEGYAKENRPWRDRTGDARKRLNGSVEERPEAYRINLAHGVDYGLFLEMAKEKKYAILEPTIRLKSNEVLKGFHGLLERVKT